MDGFGPIFIPDSKLYTIGAHWMRPMTSGEGTMNNFDWNVEVAFQTGDAGDPFAAPGVDLSGYVAEGWFGWNFGGERSHGRLHAGVFMASGDDPDTTDEIEDFTPLYGDFHANNRLGDLDFIESAVGPHNITNINVGYQHWFGDHSFMAAVHYNMLTEDTGFADDKLGLEIDLGYAFQYSKNLAFEGERRAVHAGRRPRGVRRPDRQRSGHAHQRRPQADLVSPTPHRNKKAPADDPAGAFSFQVWKGLSHASRSAA
jgi:hypothetical protein